MWDEEQFAYVSYGCFYPWGGYCRTESEQRAQEVLAVAHLLHFVYRLRVGGKGKR